MRSLIWRAMVKKACSTFDAFFAEVSRKGIPKLSANSYISVRINHALSYRVVLSIEAYLRDSVFNNLLVCHIALVAYEKLVHTLGGVTVDLLQPLLDVVEAVHVGDIVHNTDTMGAAVVGRGDCAEAFLACCIPL